MVSMNGVSFFVVHWFLLQNAHIAEASFLAASNSEDRADVKLLLMGFELSDIKTALKKFPHLSGTRLVDEAMTAILDAQEEAAKLSAMGFKRNNVETALNQFRHSSRDRRVKEAAEALKAAKEAEAFVINEKVEPQTGNTCALHATKNAYKHLGLPVPVLKHAIDVGSEWIESKLKENNSDTTKLPDNIFVVDQISTVRINKENKSILLGPVLDDILKKVINSDSQEANNNMRFAIIANTSASANYRAIGHWMVYGIEIEKKGNQGGILCHKIKMYDSDSLHVFDKTRDDVGKIIYQTLLEKIDLHEKK